MGKTVFALTAVILPIALSPVLNAEHSKVNARDATGRTALMWAATEGDMAAVKSLLAQGADINAKITVSSAITLSGNNRHEASETLGQTALFMAARWGHAEIVRLLLAAGANREAKKDGGGLMPAAQKDYADVVKLLLDAGANKEAYMFYSGSFTIEIKPPIKGKRLRPGDRFSGMNMESQLVEGVSEQDKPAGPIYVTWRGQIALTALTLASVNCHPGIVKMLLDAGANRDGHSESYLGSAYRAPTHSIQAETRELAVEAKEFAVFDIRATALDAAKEGGCTEIVDMLNATGAKNGTH